MAIDTKKKRASIVGLTYLAGPSPTPNAAQDQEWRQAVGYGYSGILATVIPLWVAAGAAPGTWSNPGGASGTWVSRSGVDTTWEKMSDT